MHTAATAVDPQILHQTSPGASPWAWTLAPRQATTLAADGAARWLHVDSGCVWLTQRNGDTQASDIWLAAGDSLALPAGSAWVLEAWPQAQLSLLLQAPAAVSQRAADAASSSALSSSLLVLPARLAAWLQSWQRATAV